MHSHLTPWSWRHLPLCRENAARQLILVGRDSFTSDQQGYGLGIRTNKLQYCLRLRRLVDGVKVCEERSRCSQGYEILQSAPNR
jgi:hypothetical protein